MLPVFAERTCRKGNLAPGNVSAVGRNFATFASFCLKTLSAYFWLLLRHGAFLRVLPRLFDLKFLYRSNRWGLTVNSAKKSISTDSAHFIGLKLTSDAYFLSNVGNPKSCESHLLCSYSPARSVHLPTPLKPRNSPTRTTL